MDVPDWTLELYGGLTARYRTGSDLAFPSRYAKKLIVYLALYPGPQNRTHVAMALWPDDAISEARRNLSTELSRLQRALRQQDLPPLLRVDRKTVGLAAGTVVTDVGEWERHLTAARRASTREGRIERLTAAVRLYRGPLAPELEFEHLDAKRREFAQNNIEAMLALSAALHEVGDDQAAIGFARRVIVEEPLREEAHHLLIDLLLRSGRSAEALAGYQRLERLLHREFGGSPSPSTRALLSSAASIHNAHPLRSARSPTLSSVSSVSSPGGYAVPRLPLPSDRFYGRERELERLQDLLRPDRLVADRSPLDSRHPDIPQEAGPGALTTLVGPAGFGKTRLALEAAHQAAAQFGNAVWFVSLADITAPCYLPDAIRDGLDLPRAGNTDPLEQIVAYLSLRPCLLVLDNLEHLIAGATPVLRVLRGRISALCLLLTSRRPLGLPGEVVMQVASLPLPAEDAPPVALRSNPCAALFENRARMARERFSVTRRSAGAVAAICRHLEGIPLAIEIAAGRCTSRTPSEILHQLTHHASTLRNRNPHAPRRHRTLEAAIVWSYETLPPTQQRLFARLSVFHGGCNVASARVVCSEPEAETHLRGLAEQSLAGIVGNAETPRYLLLRVIREFAAARLSPEEQAIVSARHANYFLALAEEAEPFFHTHDAMKWLLRLTDEQENLRAALTWFRSAEQPERFLRLAAALGEFWRLRGGFKEGREWLQAALALAPEPTSIYAKALCALGALHLDHTAARAAYQEGLSLYHMQDDRHGIAVALLGLSLLDEQLDLDRRPYAEQSLAIFQETGDVWRSAEAIKALAGFEAVQFRFDSARALAEQALAAYRAVGDRRGIARILYDKALWLQGHVRHTALLLEEALGILRALGDKGIITDVLIALAGVSRSLGDYERVEELCAESQRLAEEMGRGLSTAVSVRAHCMFMRGELDAAWDLFVVIRDARRASNAPLRVKIAEARLARVALYRNDTATARELGEACLSFFRETGFKVNVAEALITLAGVASRVSDYREAEGAYREALALYHEAEIQYGMLDCLEGLAALSSALKQWHETARLLGTADELRKVMEAPVPPVDRAAHESLRATTRSALGDRAFELAWSVGQETPLADVIRTLLEPAAHDLSADSTP